MSAADKHTPGPWVFVLGGTGDFPTWSVRMGDLGYLQLPGVAGMGTMDANARLIAAAPDMLAALRRCAQRMLADEGVNSPIYRQAKAAIDKAEGKA